MKSSPFRFVFSALAALSLAGLARADRGLDPTVNWSPPTKIAQNVNGGSVLITPNSYQHELDVTTPATVPAGFSGTVVVTPSALSDPTTGLTEPTGHTGPGSTSLTGAPGLAYITLSSGSIVGAPGQPITVPFTGPSTVVAFIVTLNFPAGSAAGTFAYYMAGTWPTSFSATDNGATINATVVPPPPSIEILTMTGPNPGTAFTPVASPGNPSFLVPSNPSFQVATGQTSAPISFTYNGATTALTLVNVWGTITNSLNQTSELTAYTIQPVSVTSINSVTLYGLDQAGQVGSNPVFTVSDGTNQYQLIQSTPFGASTTLALAFQAVTPGAVSSAAGSITTVVTTGALHVYAGTATVTNPNGPETVGLGITGLNTPSITGGATLNLTADTYRLTLNDANSLNPLQSAGQTVVFNVAPAAQQTQNKAVPSVSLTVNDPYNPLNTVTASSSGTSTASITITIPVGQSVTGVPYAIIGGTSGGTLLNAITGASLSLNGVTAPLESLLNLTGLLLNNLGTSSITGSGTLTNSILGLLSTGGLAPGNYSVVAQDNNNTNQLSGTTATATVNVLVQQQQYATPAITLAVTGSGGVSATGSGNGLTAGAAGSTATYTITIPAGQTTVAVPYLYSGGTSGGTADPLLQSATVVLTGGAFTSPVIVVPSATISGSGSIPALAAGTYTLTASDGNGAPGITGNATAAITIKVAQTATPSVTLAITGTNGVTATGSGNGITAGAPGSTANYSVTIPAGQSTISVPYSYSGGVSTGTVDPTITSAAVSLTGGAFTPPAITVGAATFSGSGTVANLSAGTYTLAATDSNGASGTAGSATAAITLTVVQAATPSVTLSITGANAVTVTGNGNGTVAGAAGSTATYAITIPSGQTTVSVPYSFSGGVSAGTLNATLTSASVSLSGGAFTPPAITLPAASIAGGGSVASLAAGTYTLTATDSNGATGSGGSATAAITLTVQQIAVPAITLKVTDPNSGATATAPSGGSATLTLTIPAGQTGVAIPYSFNGTTSGGAVLGNITSDGVTLGGTPLTPSSLTTLPANPANGSGTTASLAAGTYVLVATDSNASSTVAGGTSASATVTLTVQQAAAPAITLTVSDPNSSATVTAPSGGSASITLTLPTGQTSVAVPYAFVGTTNGTASTVLNNITSDGITQGGSAITPSSLTALPANPANGSGTTVALTAGTYVLVATDSNGPASSGGGSASATVTVTVTGGACSAPTVTATSNFTGSTYSCQNNTIWFNSTVAVNGLGAQGGILQFNNPTISFSANGSAVTLIAPAATITFSPTATKAVSTYNASSNTWITIVPAGYTGNVFLTGLSYQASSRFSASNNPVTWSGSFLGSAQGMSVQWLTSATILTYCSSDYNSCGVKPVDSGSLCQYQNSDCAGTQENYRSYQYGSACSGGSSGSGSKTISLSGLYATGVSNSGSLLAGNALDPHYLVATSSQGSRYTGSPFVDPASLAYGWVPNTSTAQWITAPGGTNIGNGAGNNSLPASGGTSLGCNYDYTLTFTMPAGADLSTVAITGTLSADDSVIVLVNGSQVTSGVPRSTDYEYNVTSSFSLNSSNASFQQGANTITFRVANENNPTPNNPSGLFVQSLGGTVSAAQNLTAVGYCSTLSTQSLGSPPTVNATSPADGSTYPFASGSSVCVPAGFTAVSPAGSGNITAISATVNGNPLGLTTTSGVGSSATATGAATLSISQAGTYALVYSGTNAYGSATATVSFTTVQVQPPVITITAPADGSTVTIPVGSTCVTVPYTLTGSTAYGAIQSVAVTLNGAAVSTAPTLTGLNTASVSGSGSLSLTAGTYTIGATDSNGVASASDQNTFTVVQGTNGGGSGGGGYSGKEYLLWLQQNSCNGQYGYDYRNGCNQSVAGGSVVPIAFGLYAGSSGWNQNNNWNCWSNGWGNYGNFVTDTTTVIAVYEIYSNNTSSTPVLYTYGASGPNPPYYSISNNQYLLEFPTAAGSHHYQVEVYSNGNSLNELGSEDIYTQGSCLPTGCSNGSRFNSTSIGSGKYIWFNSTCNVSGLSSHASTVWFDCSTINFTCNSKAVSLPAPAACIKFDPNCTTASTSFNASANCWVTVVPVGYTGNVFVCGVPYQAPSGFPTSASVSWSACFRSDTRSVNANWQWSAACYNQWSSNLNGCGVKAVDSSSLCQYKNSDRAGTPESFKSSVTGGACGTGGSNYTGTFGSSLSPSIGSSCWLDSNWN